MQEGDDCDELRAPFEPLREFFRGCALLFFEFYVCGIGFLVHEKERKGALPLDSRLESEAKRARLESLDSRLDLPAKPTMDWTHRDLCEPHGTLQPGTHLLPENLSHLHKQVVIGPTLLQIEAIADITLSDEQRNRPNDANTPPEHTRKAMLKLRLNDGKQQIVALEYKKIPNLTSKTPLGTKILICNATVRSGVVMLTPDCASFIGGGVLSAASDGNVSGVASSTHVASSPPIAASTHNHPPQSQPPPDSPSPQLTRVTSPQLTRVIPPQLSTQPAQFNVPSDARMILPSHCSTAEPMKLQSSQQTNSKPSSNLSGKESVEAVQQGNHPSLLRSLPLSALQMPPMAVGTSATQPTPKQPGCSGTRVDFAAPAPPLREVIEGYVRGDLRGVSNTLARAKCEGVLSLQVHVDPYRFEGDVKLSGPQDFEQIVPLTSDLIEKFLGYSAAQYSSDVQSVERKTRNQAKSRAMKLNRHLVGLQGVFELGVTEGGLVVNRLP